MLYQVHGVVAELMNDDSRRRPKVNMNAVGNRNRKRTFSVKTGLVLELGGIKKMERGKQYFDDRRVVSLEFLSPDVVRAQVVGNEKYSVKISAGGAPEFLCACPSFADDGFCKHCVAVILEAERNVSFETVDRTFVTRLVSRGLRAFRQTNANPGEEISRTLDKMGVTAVGASGVHGRFKYRLIENGVVTWGGNDAEKLLRAYDMLRVKDSFRFDGYFFYDGMGGNFRPVALPSDMKLPPWEHDSRNPVFDPKSIPGALDYDIAPYIVHAHSAKAYFQKTIYLLELDQVGAYWHGCTDWRVSGLILAKADVFEAAKKHSLEFSAFKNAPESMLPRVSFHADGSAEVSFYFLFTGIGSQHGLYKIAMIYAPDGRVKDNRNELLIDLGPGPIP